MSALTRSKEGLGSAFSAFSPVGASGVRPRYVRSAQCLVRTLSAA